MIKRTLTHGGPPHGCLVVLELVEPDGLVGGNDFGRLAEEDLLAVMTHTHSCIHTHIHTPYRIAYTLW